MTDTERMLADEIDQHEKTKRELLRLREQIATAERRGAEKALEIADVGCFILHPRGTCKQCDAWRYARGEAAGPEGRNE